MTLRKIFAFTTVALIMGFSSTSSNAQVRAWYHCSPNSNTPVTTMLPAAQARAYMGQGWRCTMLDIDYASSKGRACFLKNSIPGRTWYEFNPSTGQTLTMFCS